MDFHNLKFDPKTGRILSVAGTEHDLGNLNVLIGNWQSERPWETTISEDGLNLFAKSTWRGLTVELQIQAKPGPNAGYSISMLATNRSTNPLPVRISLSPRLHVSDPAQTKLVHPIKTFDNAASLLHTIDHENPQDQESSQLSLEDPGFKRTLNMLYLGADKLHILSDAKVFTASPSLDRVLAPGKSAALLTLIQEEIRQDS
ncbi:hypothetical protein [Corynebacterium caspium]|uniref:hypothetical protein n=1 Tax=Corynebacterium caspium TaxID=234828 RepID=UPI0003A1D1A6|nr:hypothetical protein [Corynebacterium caspium]WKD58867.1 hypothetical protein CCASP_02295 [Corynebacterium caspium DSM 44850]